MVNGIWLAPPGMAMVQRNQKLQIPVSYLHVLLHRATIAVSNFKCRVYD